MAKLRVLKPKHSLIYSMKLLQNVELEDWQHEHPEIAGPDGEAIPLTVHLITGTREEIREQLMQSIDAFFELTDEMKEQ
jgi:hypothetical protein